MSRRTIAVFIFLLLALGFVSPGIDLAVAKQVDTPGMTADQAKRLKERAERVQQRRKARISQQDREAAAERAKAARGGAAQKAAPERGGKEVAK